MMPMKKLKSFKNLSVRPNRTRFLVTPKISPDNSHFTSENGPLEKENSY